MSLLEISKAKNSLLPILVVPSLIKGKYTFKNIYLFSDVNEQINILNLLNIKTSYNNNDLLIDSTNLIIPDDLEINQNRKTRGVIYFMGALIKYKKNIKYNIPGGCNLGERKIDIHLNFFENINNKIIKTDNYYEINSKNINNIDNIEYNLKKISVGATINCILSSIYGNSGIVKLYNIAIDPYVIDLINLLKEIKINIFVNVENRTLIIERKKIDYLNKPIIYNIIEDPIIIGTYIVLCLLFNKKYTITINNLSILGEFLNVLLEIGVEYKEVDLNKYIFFKNKTKKNNIVIVTKEFPGFYTDLQPIFLCLCNHYSLNVEIIENVMNERFAYLNELKKIGYNFEYVKNNHIKLLDFKIKNNIENINFTDLRGGFVIYIELHKYNFNLDKIVIDNFDVIFRGYDIEYIKCNFLK